MSGRESESAQEFGRYQLRTLSVDMGHDSFQEMNCAQKTFVVLYLKGQFGGDMH